MCAGAGGDLHRLDPHRPERVGAVPLHPGHHLLPGAPCLCRLRPGHLLEADQRTGTVLIHTTQNDARVKRGRMIQFYFTFDKLSTSLYLQKSFQI